MSKLAAAAYAAYCLGVGGKTFDDKPLPTFEQLGERQKAGWEAAATGFVSGAKLGEQVQSKTGMQGIVRTLAIDRFGRAGCWIEGSDSAGRPFEHFVYECDLLPQNSLELG